MATQAVFVILQNKKPGRSVSDRLQRGQKVAVPLNASEMRRMRVRLIAGTICAIFSPFIFKKISSGAFVTPGCHSSMSLLVDTSGCHFDRIMGKRENSMRRVVPQHARSV